MGRNSDTCSNLLMGTRNNSRSSDSSSTMTTLVKVKESVQVEWQIVIAHALERSENYQGMVSPTFTFNDTTWRMMLVGKFLYDTDSSHLIILRNDDHNNAVEFTLGLKKTDGSIERLQQDILKSDDKSSDYLFEKMSEIMSSDELTPSGILTVVCSLRLVQYESHRDMLEEPPKSKKMKKLDTLSQNYKKLLKDQVMCDVVLHVKDKEFKAHKAVLAARSEVFAAMFMHDTMEKRKGIVTIPDCDPECFQLFLDFLYCGVLEELTERNAISLFETAEKYGILELKRICCEQLKENISHENWHDIANLSVVYGEETLFTAVQNFFNSHLRAIFNSPEWMQMLQTEYDLVDKLLKGFAATLKIPASSTS